MNLSVVITTFNNQDVIQDCLQSVKNIADEIIVIDNHSSDKTVSIAKKYTKNVHLHDNNLLVLNKAKNFGFTKAKSKWILSLDSDERVSTRLAKEIKSVLSIKSSTTTPAAYQIPRKNIIFGQWIKHGLWYPDYQTRLFQKNRAEFPEKHNHEKLKVQGSLFTLKGHLIHYNYTSVSQYVSKINRQYTDNEAQSFLELGKKIHWYDAIRMPLSDFITNFFARSGYKDGLHGLVLSLLQAFYTLVVFAKIWEKQDFKTYNSKAFLKESKMEFTDKLSQMRYWYLQKQGVKSKIKKFLARI